MRVILSILLRKSVEYRVNAFLYAKCPLLYTRHLGSRRLPKNNRKYTHNIISKPILVAFFSPERPLFRNFDIYASPNKPI